MVVINVYTNFKLHKKRIASYEKGFERRLRLWTKGKTAFLFQIPQILLSENNIKKKTVSPDWL